MFIQTPVLCALGHLLKNSKIRLTHDMKKCGLDWTSIVVGKFNRQVLV